MEGEGIMRYNVEKVMLVAVAVVIAVGLTSCNKTPTVPKTSALPIMPLPAQFNGVAAMISAPNGTDISERPIRLLYTLTNTSGQPITLYAVGRNSEPKIVGEEGYEARGLTGPPTNVTLAPGASQSWGVQVSAGKPSHGETNSISVTVDEGIGYGIMVRNLHTVFLSMEFSSAMFQPLPATPVYAPANGAPGNSKIVSWTAAPTTKVLATPWIELTVK
jgi:hypothetical protein